MRSVGDRITESYGTLTARIGLGFASTNTDSHRPIQFRIRSPTDRITNSIGWKKIKPTYLCHGTFKFSSNTKKYKYKQFNENTN